MSRSPGPLLAIVVLSVALAARSSASTVTVPDHFPTIQLALDSGADTVRIRAGTYAERPNVSSDDGNRVLEGLPADGVRPTIEGLTFSLNHEVFVSGCRFTRPLDLRAGAGFARLTFDSCDLDSGLVHHIADTNDYEWVAIYRSRIRGNVTLPAFSSVCEADTFEACGVLFDNESSAQVRGCVFEGPPAASGGAIRFLGSGGSGAHVRDNQIERYVMGIASGGLDASTTVDGNHIEQCTVGISIANENDDTVSNNVILDCGTGITAAVYSSLVVSGNVVLGSTDAGIDLHADNATHPQILGNTVGRSGSDGIRLELYSSSGATFRNNTSYRNGGAGIHVRSGDPYDMFLTHNIGFENGTYGVDADTSAVPDSCNDWYGNLAGATRGVTLSGTDLAVEPLFCNVHIDSVALSAKSPVLDAAGCGLIGARGVGCAITPTLVSLFTAEREAEGVRVRWRVADPGRFGEVWPERAETRSGPWAAIAFERATEGEAEAALDRNAAAGNEYWYRLRAREGNETLVIGQPIAVEANGSHGFQLVRVSPNPGAGPQVVTFSLPREATVELDVFDIQGRHVASLVRRMLPAGSHTAEWSGATAAAPGLHIVRFRSPGGEQVQRFVRLK